MPQPPALSAKDIADSRLIQDRAPGGEKKREGERRWRQDEVCPIRTVTDGAEAVMGSDPGEDVMFELF